ncbi:MAG: hypothetical protein ACRDPW_01970, partial [Mycobacteriales bacterium]
MAQPEGAIPPQEVAKYRDGQRSLYEKWIMALLSQIGRARDAGSRAPLDEQDIAKISEFFRKRPPGEEPFSLLQANRLCALPPWLTAEAARAELAELCANSDTGSWHGLKPASFLSPLISPGNNTPKLALLAAAELPGAGPADPEKTPGALVSVANAAVLNMPTRVHAHFVAGEEPLETLAAAAKAKGGDIATIVVGLPLPGFPLPLAAPGKPARYTPSAFNVTVVYQLVALYLR